MNPSLTQRFFLTISGMLLVSGCASTPTKVVQAAPPSQVSLIISGARNLELEPCGCTVSSFGGVEREAKLREDWQKLPDRSFLSLSVGTTFWPFEYSASKKDLYLKKASFVVEAMNLLRINAFAPSATDLSFGVIQVQALQAAAKFPFVSTNILGADHKPLFNRFSRFETEAGTVSVVALASQGKGKDYEVANAENALKEVWPEVMLRPGLVVLLSSLSSRELDAVLAKFPEIRVVVDASPGEPRDVEMRGVSRIYVHPENRGRNLSRIDIAGGSLKPNFYNEDMQSFLSSQIYDLRTATWALEDEAKSESKTKGLKAKLAYNRRKIALLQTNYVTDPTQATAIAFSSRMLASDLNSPENDLAKVVKRYHDTVRELALVEPAADE